MLTIEPITIFPPSKKGDKLGQKITKITNNKKYQTLREKPLAKPL